MTKLWSKVAPTLEEQPTRLARIFVQLCRGRGKTISLKSLLAFLIQCHIEKLRAGTI